MPKNSKTAPITPDYNTLEISHIVEIPTNMAKIQYKVLCSNGKDFTYTFSIPNDPPLVKYATAIDSAKNVIDNELGFINKKS